MVRSVVRTLNARATQAVCITQRGTHPLTRAGAVRCRQFSEALYARGRHRRGRPRGRCGREDIIAAFAGEDTLTRHKVGKLLDITLEVLELATRYDLIERSKVGGHARYTLNAVLKALGFRA